MRFRLVLALVAVLTIATSCSASATIEAPTAAAAPTLDAPVTDLEPDHRTLEAVVPEPEPTGTLALPEVVPPELMIRYQTIVGLGYGLGPDPIAMVKVPYDQPVGPDSYASLELRDADDQTLEVLPVYDAQASLHDQRVLQEPGADEAFGLSWNPEIAGATSIYMRIGDRGLTTLRAFDFVLEVTESNEAIHTTQRFEPTLPDESVQPLLYQTIAVSAGGEWVDLPFKSQHTQMTFPMEDLFKDAASVGIADDTLWFAISTTNGFRIETKVVGPFQR